MNEIKLKGIKGMSEHFKTDGKVKLKDVMSVQMVHEKADRFHMAFQLKESSVTIIDAETKQIYSLTGEQVQNILNLSI